MLVLTLCVSLCAGCAQRGRDAAEGDAWILGMEAQTLAGEAFSGGVLAENRLTLLNVWASWCAPCAEELPALQAIAEACAADGVGVIGVLQDGVTELGVPDARAIEAGASLLEAAGATFPVLLPEEALLTNLLRDVQALPTTYLLDGRGEIVQAVIGARSEAEWREVVDAWLAP